MILNLAMISLTTLKSQGGSNITKKKNQLDDVKFNQLYKELLQSNNIQPI